MMNLKEVFNDRKSSTEGNGMYFWLRLVHRDCDHPKIYDLVNVFQFLLVNSDEYLSASRKT